MSRWLKSMCHGMDYIAGAAIVTIIKKLAENGCELKTQKGLRETSGFNFSNKLFVWSFKINVYSV